MQVLSWPDGICFLKHLGDDANVAAVGKLQGKPDFAFVVHLFDGDGAAFVLNRGVVVLTSGDDAVA